MITSELLEGLSVEELEALADGMLAPSSQNLLSDLLARKGDLTPSESKELDDLLKKTDQLTLIKTRARYTLAHTVAAVGS